MKPMCLCVFFVLFANLLFAHESRPLYIQLTETTPLHFSVKLNVPNSVPENNLPELIFPDFFLEHEHEKTIRTTASGYLITRNLETQGEKLEEQILAIHFPAFNPSITTIVQIELVDKQIHTLVVSPGETQFTVPKNASFGEVIGQYTWLGIEHIWAGIDHLLFVACLVFIAGFNRKLLIAITGFTLAHSITLFLSALDWINLPIAPVEACIALSIIFLCYEIIHHHTTQQSLTYRYPVAVSSSFGLLHGLGFASVLNEIGLPHQSKMTALLFFNVGVEIGQIIFIFLIFILFNLFIWFLKKQIAPKFQTIGLNGSIYFIGILASYWFFERIFA